MRGLTRNILILSVCSLLISYLAFNLGPRGGDVEKAFRVERGEGFSIVAERLLSEGFIKSSGMLKFYGVISGNAGRVKPGIYILNSNDSAVRILGRLVSGPQDIKAVVIEGSTLRDIDTQLSDLGIVEVGSIRSLAIAKVKDDYPFLAGRTSLEGFLFPDTYQFHPASDAETVTRKFLDNFKTKAYPEFVLRGGNFYDKLKIASLVEKEVPDHTDDGALVAGIIERRLAIGMGLQVDATVLYAKCGGALLTCKDNRLSRSDFSIDSPYNTYIHRGLPPTPIANPGIAAIRAALNPQKSNYLFYLSDPKTKRTIFSETFEEHNENRAKYLGL